MDNLVTPLSQGLIHGLTIAGLVQHQRDQNEAMQRQKFLDARNQRIEDMTLANQAEDRSRRLTAENNAADSAALAGGATPLQNGMRNSTMAPPAGQASFTAPLSFGADPLPSAGAPLPTGAAGPVQQLPAPPSGPGMSFSDPLAAMRGSVQPTQVQAKPTSGPEFGLVQTLPSGMQVQQPTVAETNALQQRRDQLKAQQEIAIAKAKRTFTDPDTGEEQDSLGTPLVNNRSTVAAENKRSADEIAARAKIAADTDKRERDIAAGVQAGDNSRTGRRIQAERDIAAAKTGASPLKSQAQLNAIEKTKGAAYQKAEFDYRTGLARLTKQYAGEGNIPDGEKAALLDKLNTSKRGIDDTYVNQRGALGLETTPVDFTKQGAGKKAGAAAPTQGAPTKDASAAPSTTPASVGQPKVFPRAKLAAYATQNKMSVADTEAALKRKGYTVQ